MNDDQPRPDTGHLDMSPHDQALDMSLDTSLSIREAATRADVTEKTVRRWIKGGRLHAVKLGGQYRMTLADLDRARDTPTEGSVHPAGTHDVDSGRSSPRGGMSDDLDTGHGLGRHTDPVDLAPLTDLIRDQNRRIEELSSAAAFWQVRAHQAEEQLKSLTAGETPPEAASEAPQSPERDGSTPTGLVAWVRRLWRS